MNSPCKYSRPTIFAADMVRALWDGRKTQTRRLITSPLVKWLLKDYTKYPVGLIEKINITERVPPSIKEGFLPEDPRFLWVKENFRFFNASKECGCSDHPCGCPGDGSVIYAASSYRADSKWRPSIHMPRQASRMTLTVTKFRIERLTDISDHDAAAEGIDWYEGGDNGSFGHSGGGFLDYSKPDDGDYSLSAVDSYRSLWQTLHGKDSWDEKTMVGIFDFTVSKSNIDNVLDQKGLSQ